MGLLDRAGFGQPWRTPPFFPQQPAEGAGMPTPPVFPNNKGPIPAAPQQGWGARLNSGFQNLNNNALFTLGMSLLGNAQGSNWGGVGQDMRDFGAQQMQRQALDNEMRRQKAGDARTEQQFSWQTEDRQRQTQQRQAMDEWVRTLPPDQQAAARANPELAYEVFMQAQAQANAPITPYQQAQLNLQRREQDVQASIARERMNIDRPLRGPDASLMQSVREAADRSSALAQLGSIFMEQNARTGTGPERRLNPFNQFDSGYQTMNSVVSQMVPYMRVPGSGATSDYEQRLYQQGVQSPNNSPAANQAIYRNQQTLAELSQQRRYFYEEYASRNGTLNGAEQAFQSSPEFQRIARSNPAQPERQVAPAQQQQPAAQTGGITPEQARAELDRRERARQQSSVYGNQPGGYRGR